MTNCSSCGASMADGASFCASCGTSVSGAAAAGGAATSVAVRQAAAQAQSAVMNLGQEKIIALVGGLLGVLGAFLPFYAIPTDSMLGATDINPSLMGQGGIGLLVLALAIVLGALPFVIAQNRLVTAIGFALATFVIGVIIGGRALAFFGQQVPVDFGAGFYLGLLGFAVLAYGYGRKAIAS